MTDLKIIDQEISRLRARIKADRQKVNKLNEIAFEQRTNQIVYPDKKSKERVDNIIEIVCEYFGTHINELKSKHQRGHKGMVRKFLAYFLYNKTFLTTKYVSLILGVNSSNITNSNRSLETILQVDKKYKIYLNDLRIKLDNL